MIWSKTASHLHAPAGIRLTMRGGIIHRRNDARIIQPRRADHAEHADDVAGAVAIGRDDGRGAGQREQLVLRADEDAHALGAARRGRAGRSRRAWSPRSSNSSRTRSRSSMRMQVVEQVGMAAHDQLAVVARRRPTSWRGRPRSPSASAGRARSRLCVHRLLELGARLGERAAADTRIEEVRRLGQRRHRHARRQRRSRGSRSGRPRPPAPPARAPARGARTRCASAARWLCRQHHAGAARQAGQHASSPR